jgi:hypothetical protein
MKRARHVLRVGNRTASYRILVRIPGGKRALIKPILKCIFKK